PAVPFQSPHRRGAPLLRRLQMLHQPLFLVSVPSSSGRAPPRSSFTKTKEKRHQSVSVPSSSGRAPPPGPSIPALCSPTSVFQSPHRRGAPLLSTRTPATAWAILVFQSPHRRGAPLLV